MAAEQILSATISASTCA